MTLCYTDSINVAARQWDIRDWITMRGREMC